MSLLPFFIGVYAVIISSLYFFLPLYLQGSLGFTGGQIGLIYAVLTMTAILVSFPVGVTADRYPARILTRLGLVGIAACLWGLSEVRHFWTFLLVIFGSGLSLQFFRLSLDSLLFKENHDNASRRFGHYNSWRMGGMMLGALGGGMLLYSLDFPRPLKLLALGVLVLLFLTSRLPRSPGVRTSLLQYGRDFL
ncbi:MAG: MFS transporter, partial [Syntrophales bacterium]|nr:MFS transporter [Syntrophales bacterium]